MDSITPKQQRFVDEYIIDLNATAAYKRAGYKGEDNTAEASASRMLSNVKIACKIKELLDKKSTELGIDQTYVLTRIKETIERCAQTRPVYDKSGNPMMVETANGELAAAYVFDAANVLKGSELLGKYVGLRGFGRESENSTPINVRYSMDENLLEVARRIAFVLARGSGRIINHK